MRIIPVIDVRQGIVVHADGGPRTHYQPLLSPLVDSCEIEHVAEALTRITRSNEIYLADLDAIESGAGLPSPQLAEYLQKSPYSILLDCGYRNDLTVLPDPRIRMVIGSETLDFQAIANENIPDCRSICSLDLRSGTLLGCQPGVLNDPYEYGIRMVGRGYQTILILDLDRVGRGHGPSGLSLIERLRNYSSSLEILVGGGIRNHDDIHRVADLGADAVLVATAIHQGTVTHL